jgi:acetylglutamate/LysW-gamma-L-alpha-aminoadipate kinase
MKPSISPHQTIVVKVGGAAGVDFSAISIDVAGLIESGQRLVLVHGGSAEANNLGLALDYPPRFITSPSGHSSRYTDLHTLEIFTMAVNGKINTSLVSQLQGLGVNALGLCGLDGRLIQAERKQAVISIENGRRRVIRDDYTGKIHAINAALLHILLESEFVPVIAPLALGQAGEALNVDADRAAAAIAAALKADRLILLTAVPGLMKSFPDENTLIQHLPLSQLENALGYAQGRMKKKVLGVQEALGGGVSQSIIADGRVEAPISNALSGNGTWIE